MKTLDNSHKEVLTHWNTLEQMKQCANEAQEYLIQVAQHTFKAIGVKVAERLHIDDAVRKDEYFEFYPTKAAQWKGSTAPLWAIGVEQISVKRILYPTLDEYCRVYFYSPYRADNATAKDKTDRVATAVAPPDGFSMTMDFPRRGYFIEARISLITVDEFLDESKLSRTFSDAVSPIIKWYLNCEDLLLKAVS
jgi:hypothetical protein